MLRQRHKQDINTVYSLAIISASHVLLQATSLAIIGMNSIFTTEQEKKSKLALVSQNKN